MAQMLIIARHGGYLSHVAEDEGFALSESGKEEVDALASRMKAKGYFAGPLVIVSSTARRARESAERIAKVAGVPVRSEEGLWLDNRHDGWGLLRVISFLDDQFKEADAVLFVGHLDHGHHLAWMFGRDKLKADFKGLHKLSYGSAYAIDLERKTCQPV